MAIAERINVEQPPFQQLAQQLGRTRSSLQISNVQYPKLDSDNGIGGKKLLEVVSDILYTGSVPNRAA